MLIATGFSLFLKDSDKKPSISLPIGSHRQNNWDAALPVFRPSIWELEWNETELNHMHWEWSFRKSWEIWERLFLPSPNFFRFVPKESKPSDI